MLLAFFVSACARSCQYGNMATSGAASGKPQYDNISVPVYWFYYNVSIEKFTEPAHDHGCLSTLLHQIWDIAIKPTNHKEEQFFMSHRWWFLWQTVVIWDLFYKGFMSWWYKLVIMICVLIFIELIHKITTVHRSTQQICHWICKILTWSDHYSCKRIESFALWAQTSFVKWGLGMFVLMAWEIKV